MSKASDFKITSLPKLNVLDSNFHHYSGDLHLDEETSFFFYLTKYNKVEEKKKLLIWLNGDVSNLIKPNSTSLDGPILEKGIFNITSQSLEIVEEGWHTFVDVLAIDQPLGTGYSKGPREKYSRDVQEAGNMFLKVVTKFLTVFEEYNHYEFYLAGESFAGIWIPNFANLMLQTDKFKDKLKGIAIGNGWMDPKNQYGSLIPFVEKHRVLTDDNLEKYKEAGRPCLNSLNNITTATTPVCEDFMKLLTELTFQPNDKNLSGKGKGTCINLYDVRLRDQYPECGMLWPPNVNDFRSYLKDPKVAEALHTTIGKDGWYECTPTVYDSIDPSLVLPTIQLLPNLLQHIKVLIFVGDQDLMVNYLGLTASLDTLQWNRQTGFLDNQFKDLDEMVEVKSRDNLSFAKISQASHMANYDQPKTTSNLLRWYLDGIHNKSPFEIQFLKANTPTVNTTTPLTKGEVQGVEPSPSNLGTLMLVGFISLFTLFGFYKIYKMSVEPQFKRVESIELDPTTFDDRYLDLNDDEDIEHPTQTP